MGVKNWNGIQGADIRQSARSTREEWVKYILLETEEKKWKRAAGVMRKWEKCCADRVIRAVEVGNMARLQDERVLGKG